MDDLNELEQLIAARTPLIFCETADPARAEELFRRLARRNEHPLYRWTLATGLQRLDGDTAAQRFNAKPADVLGHILSVTEAGYYLLLDLGASLSDPLTVSQLRELGLRHTQVPHALVLVGTALEVPAELRAVASTFELDRPEAAELEAMLRGEVEAWLRNQGRRVQASREAIEALLRSLAGLTHADARRLIRQAIQDGSIDRNDLSALARAKHRLLDQGGVLSFETEQVEPDQVAGLARLKHWLAQRKSSFLAASPPPGLDPPKGVLLLGVQGAGKSLAAKSIAGAWSLPLLRLDFAALYNKYHGETERNLREALRTAVAMAPCVLWMDEIEKGLGGEDEDGIGRRVLGTLLTWMAERRQRVFLVATANDIEALPPELLRKGRFDEIFFVDLPGDEARRQVLEIHLRKRGVDPGALSLDEAVTASAGFSGAEIEQAVVGALYSAHAAQSSLDGAGVARELATTRPLSITMAERVAALRDWARSRTVPAD